MDARSSLARSLATRLTVAVVPVVIAVGFLLAGVVGSALVMSGIAALAAVAVGAPVVYVTARSAARRTTEASDALTEELGRRMGRADEDRRMRDSILGAMDDGVILVAGESVQYANPAAARLLGESPTDLRALGPAALRLLVRRIREGGAAHSEDVETAVPPRLVRATAMQLDGHDRVLLVLRDVTEERRVEAMRRDFVADASHELKTPAAAIRAAAETLAGALEDDPGAARRFVAQLDREAVRLANIVSDLLDLSRLETERPELRPIHLDRLVAAEVERFRERAETAGVALRSDVRPASVRGEEKGLHLLLANLVDNAIRHTGSGGEVRVALEGRGGEVVLAVSDTGVGIPSRDLPRIFERFYRVDRARSRQTGGTGLGLSIARHVVEQHGGRIEVESELGRGSTFRVFLAAEG